MHIVNDTLSIVNFSFAYGLQLFYICTYHELEYNNREQTACYKAPIYKEELS